ncbi:MAG: ATP-binding protein [Desulfovibrionaceae bacterium]
MVADSLRARFLLWTWGLLLLALGASFWSASDAVEQQMVRETQERAVAHLDTIIWLLQNAQEFQDLEGLDKWTSDLGKRMGVRITYIHNGRVLADSSVPFPRLPSLEDHSARPEVVAANEGKLGVDQRDSPTLEKEMIYAARLAPAIAGLPSGVLRVAAPLSQVWKRSATLHKRFMVIFGLTLAASVLLSLLLSRRISKSVRIFSNMARAISKGEFSRRVGPIPGGEFRDLAETINHMAESIESHIALIENQRGQLAAVFESMSDGVMVLDEQGRIEVANRTLGEMFPNVAQLMGKTPIEALRDMEVQHAVDVMRTSPEDREKLTLRTKTADGRPVEVECASIAAPSGSNRNARQLFFLFRDLSSFQRNEKILKDFLTNASHQLKTPLTSIRGFSETLLEAPPADPDKARNFLGRILDNANRMASIINGLLQLARSERPLARTEVEPVSVSRVLQSVLESLAFPIQEKDLHIHQDVDPDIMVQAVRTDLEMVFTNLMENAVRNSPQGGRIVLRAKSSGDLVETTVADDGPGVDPMIRDRIFEPFFRANANPVGGDSGSGLGLAICRKSLERLGGKIKLAPGRIETQGAAFVVILPTPS